MAAAAGNSSSFYDEEDDLEEEEEEDDERGSDFLSRVSTLVLATTRLNKIKKKKTKVVRPNLPWTFGAAKATTSFEEEERERGV